jgi:GLTT repeat (6 copies)
VPNRRRRRLSIAMSAVAALAVTSPVAIVAVNDLAAATKPAPQHREFVQAALITDLPNELISVLSQGLSQFGINLPPLPGTGFLTGTGSTIPPVLTAPGLTTPGLTTPGLTTPGLTTPGLTTPGVSVPPATATGPALTDPGLTNPALTNPALTNPTVTTPGLTTPPAPIDPGLTPISTDPLLPTPSEMPISAPLGPDPALGTYPILGDPSLATMPAATGGGGLVDELSNAANQLGASQAIDLLKGVVVPAITSAIKSAAPPVVPAAPPAPAPLPEPGA